MPTHRKLGKRATAGVALAVATLLSVASALSAHDLFLRADRYFVAPNSTVLLRVLNGSFSKSENAVTNDRLRDLSFVAPAGTRQLDTSAWVSRGDTSTLSIRLGEA